MSLSNIPPVSQFASSFSNGSSNALLSSNESEIFNESNKVFLLVKELAGKYGISYDAIKNVAYVNSTIFFNVKKNAELTLFENGQVSIGNSMIKGEKLAFLIEKIIGVCEDKEVDELFEELGYFENQESLQQVTSSKFENFQEAIPSEIPSFSEAIVDVNSEKLEENLQEEPQLEAISIEHPEESESVKVEAELSGLDMD